MREGWLRLALKDVLDARSGYWGTALADGQSSVEAKIVRNADISPSHELKSFATRFLSPAEALASEVMPGDVLVTASGEIGKVWLATDVGFHASNFVRRLRPRPDVLTGAFAALWLQGPVGRQQLSAHSGGSTIRNLFGSFMRQVEIALPPLDEQRRIVDLIGSLDAAIAAAWRVAATAETAGIAVVDEALARGSHWRRTAIGAVLEIARGGSPRPIEDYLTAAPDGVNWIKIGDVAIGDKHVTQAAERIRPEGVTRSRRVEPGDFILSNSMSFGRPYIVAIDGCIHDGWLVLRDSAGVFDQDFLYWLLRSHGAQREFRARAAGSGVRNLNIGVVASVEVPLPPLEEQRAIARAADAAANSGRAARRCAEAAEVSRRVLLGDLLSGTHEIPASYDLLLGAA